MRTIPVNPGLEPRLAEQVTRYAPKLGRPVPRCSPSGARPDGNRDLLANPHIQLQRTIRNGPIHHFQPSTETGQLQSLCRRTREMRP